MPKIKVKPSIAFFDFDGTITKRDSMWLFLKYLSGKNAFYKKIVTLIPSMTLFKLGIINSKKVKEKIFKLFFENIDISTFDEKCKKFTKEILIDYLRPEVLNKLDWHREKNHQIVVVSASPQNWIKYWCKEQGIALIATELEVSKGKVTGLIVGENCQGDQKVVRIRQRYELDQFNLIYAYGDSQGDAEMLAIADKAFYRVFS